MSGELMALPGENHCLLTTLIKSDHIALHARYIYLPYADTLEFHTHVEQYSSPFYYNRVIATN